MKNVKITDTKLKEASGDLRHAATIIEAALNGVTPRSTAVRFVGALRDRASELDAAAESESVDYDISDFLKQGVPSPKPGGCGA